MQKDSIKREQSQAGLSFAERKNRRSLAGGESNFRPQVKNKLLLLLALLMTAATGATAQTEELLTTITLGGDPWSIQPVYTESGRATLSTSGTVEEGWVVPEVYGWKNSSSSEIGSVTITAAEGYEITKVVFWDYDMMEGYRNALTDNASPFTCYLKKSQRSLNENMSSPNGYNIAKIEVYGYAAPAAASGYTVSLKSDVKDADNWTVKVGEGEAQALPIGGLKGDGSETVTLQYNGRLKVKGVKATSDAAPAAKPVTPATPLTVEALTAGTIVVQSPKNGMQYSLNGGAKTDVSGNTANIPVEAGDKVAFYGDGTSITVYDGTVIQGSGEGFTCKVYGNIMSLVDENNYETATTLPNVDYVFYELFSGNTALTDASQLLLPATTLASRCYYSMFRNCYHLTAAPALPATTLANYCYSNMFQGCSALTAAPALPATTLANYCYIYMFSGCSGLTAAPALPATTLANSCYRQMFYGCENLTTAPVLPAETLVSSCYNSMFYGCSNLSSVTCLATSLGASNTTNNWLNHVSATGTFTAASGATWTEGSANGIPSGWTRVNQ